MSYFKFSYKFFKWILLQNNKFISVTFHKNDNFTMPGLTQAIYTGNHKYPHVFEIWSTAL